MQPRLSMSEDSLRRSGGAQAIVCPRCSTKSMFWRSHTPQIDGCGFETYAFDCTDCGAPLVGIIDPADDMLLLTEAA